MQFMPKEQLVATSEYIVIAKMQDISDAGETAQWRATEAKIIKNKLKVVESIKGSLAPEKPLILYTFKFDGWMEDNVELPPVSSNVLLFLKRDEKGELKPANGIQGVWEIDSAGKSNYGTLKEIQEIVKNQGDKIKKSCSSKTFISLLEMAETQTQLGHYSKALEAYRKAYGICPMRDLEEQMAWLLGEVSVEDREVIKLW